MFTDSCGPLLLVDEHRHRALKLAIQAHGPDACDTEAVLMTADKYRRFLASESDQISGGECSACDQAAELPIVLGCTARDQITGLQGIVIGITHWLNGCVRVTLQPQSVRDGKPEDASTFDVEQIEAIDLPAFAVGPPTGGPMPNPTRPAFPGKQ